jgi:hypothetical protein
MERHNIGYHDEEDFGEHFQLQVRFLNHFRVRVLILMFHSTEMKGFFVDSYNLI